MTLIKRFEGHSALNEQVRADWITAIELNPDRFEAYLYIPSEEAETAESTDEYQEETVTSLDSHEETLAYLDPEIVSVVDCPDEQESFLMDDDGEEGLGEGVEPLLLRIGSTSVPIGAVLEWEEEISTEESRTVWWYVHSSLGYGTANVGEVYICIPMRNFDSSELTKPDSTEDTTTDTTEDTTTDTSTDTTSEESTVTEI